MRKAKWLLILLTLMLVQLSPSAWGEIPVLIRFHENPRQAEAALIARNGGRVNRQFQLVPAVAARLPARAIEALRAAPGVAAVELDGTVELHDYTTVWGFRGLVPPPSIAVSGSKTGRNQFQCWRPGFEWRCLIRASTTIIWTWRRTIVADTTLLTITPIRGMTMDTERISQVRLPLC